jgi:lycopene beta-cyclase
MGILLIFSAYVFLNSHNQKYTSLIAIIFGFTISKLKSYYDYIITGAGCAGLSLLLQILQHKKLHDKSILIVDKSPKVTNDRTWCFWEKEPGLFESIVHHRWTKLNFFSPTVKRTLNISPYEYKMIRGIDFFRYVTLLYGD